MTNYRSIIHGEMERMPLLWIDTDFSATDMLTIYAASLEEDFEVVGFSDNASTFTEKVADNLEELGYITPITSKVEGFEDLLDTEAPDHLMAMASEDAAGLDFLLLGNPLNLYEAYSFEEDVNDHMDTVILSLGKVLERGDGMLKTEASLANPEVFQELGQIGHQRLLLEPSVLNQVELEEGTIRGIDRVLEELGFPADADYTLDSLLALFLYLEPQAFIFEEVGMHIHNEKEERGYLHFTEGKDYLLINQMNAQQFEDWLKKVFQ